MKVALYKMVYNILPKYNNTPTHARLCFKKACNYKSFILFTPTYGTFSNSESINHGNDIQAS